jgi:hypothetical protein
MTEGSLRKNTSYGLVAAHFLLILLVFLLWAFHGFTFSEMTTTVAVLLPIFATHTTAITKYLVKNRAVVVDTNPKLVTGEFKFMALGIPTVFVLLILSLILLKAFNIAFGTFDEFKISLALCESIFGVYMTLIITALYKP